MRALFACGVIGPLLFVVVFTIEGTLRPGYSARRHFVSSLALGPRGWVQIASFVICGALVTLFSMAIDGALEPWLFRAFGVGLMVAGVCVTDASVGDDYAGRAVAPGTRHSMVHNLASVVVFASLAFATFTWAWRADTVWAVYSALTGLVVIGFFVGGAVMLQREARGEISDAPLGAYQRLAIIPGWTWVALLALHLLRSA